MTSGDKKKPRVVATPIGVGLRSKDHNFIVLFSVGTSGRGLAPLQTLPLCATLGGSRPRLLPPPPLAALWGPGIGRTLLKSLIVAVFGAGRSQEDRTRYPRIIWFSHPRHACPGS